MMTRTNQSVFSHILALCVAVAMSVLFRVLLLGDIKISDMMALALATLLLYRFDQFADDQLQSNPPSGIMAIFKDFFSPFPFNLNVAASSILVGCAWFISPQVLLACIFISPLLLAYFLLILYVPAFGGNLKSLFASLLFMAGCLAGESMFILFSSTEPSLYLVVISAWALIFQNMWISKANQSSFFVNSTLQWVTLGIAVSALVFLFVAHLSGLSNVETIVFKMVMTALAQYVAAMVWPKSKRIAVDLVLLFGLTLSLLLII